MTIWGGSYFQYFHGRKFSHYPIEDSPKAFGVNWKLTITPTSLPHPLFHPHALPPQESLQRLPEDIIELSFQARVQNMVLAALRNS